MKPETAAFLQKSRDFLAKADLALTIWPDEAGRFAYSAGFHAAQALIFQRTSSVSKTHSGVHSNFHRLMRDEPDFNEELRSFLGQSFNLKMTADYMTGDVDPVTPERAARAIRKAHQFVDYIVGLLPPADPSIMPPPNNDQV